MARKPTKKKPDPEPPPEEKRLDEQIAKKRVVGERINEIRRAEVRLLLSIERCKWATRTSFWMPAHEFTGRWWRTFPWERYTPPWVCSWHVLARKLQAVASTLGIIPAELVPTGEGLSLALERAPVAFVRTEFLGVLRNPNDKSVRRERARKLAEKISGDDNGGCWDYYHTLFALIGAEVERRCEVAIRELTATLTDGPAAETVPQPSVTPKKPSDDASGTRGDGTEAPEHPRTLGEAQDWLMTRAGIRSCLDIKGAPWASSKKLKVRLGLPAHSTDGASWYRVRDLLRAVKAAAPEGWAEKSKPEGRAIDADVRKLLRRPEWEPGE